MHACFTGDVTNAFNMLNKAFNELSSQHTRIADDTQVYISMPASDHSDAMRRLSDCITQILNWMASNRLKLNEEETQVIWLGTHQHKLTLPSATVQLSTAVNDLMYFSTPVRIQSLLFHKYIKET